MPQIGDKYDPRYDSNDTVIVDESDPTYNYVGRAPRQAVVQAATNGEDEAIWHITRTTKVSPFKTEQASPLYDQIWDDRGTITTYA